MVRLLVLFVSAIVSAGIAGSTFANEDIWSGSKIIPIQTAQAERSAVPRVILAQAELPDLSGVDWYLTADLDSLPARDPASVFDCVGRINLVMAFHRSDYAVRNASVKMQWINPYGELELTSERPDYASFGDEAFRTSGIVLRRPQGGGLFSLLDHSAGMERFIGEWEVKVWIADREIGSLPFSVEC